ncbi:MAG TPA: hypothetical protein VNO26_05630 [Candidatus Limnocylindria bacterium]|nr:hypothetical protein [Candidatus Limnocylindria bacterium]
MPADADEEATAQAVSTAVETGTDGIVVPGDLLVEGATLPRRNPSLYNEIAAMNLAQRLKLALRGNRDARALLARDNNKIVRRFVLNNPMITEEEIINIARDKNSTEEVLRVISERGDWTKSYGVRMALATNPKTPLAIAQKFLATLLIQDLARIAKSKDIPQAVVIQARKIVIAHRERGQ